MKKYLPLRSASAVAFAAALILAPDAQASLYGSGGTETLLDNDTVAVHTFTNNGTFTLKTRLSTFSSSAAVAAAVRNAVAAAVAAALSKTRPTALQLEPIR